MENKISIDEERKKKKKNWLCISLIIFILALVLSILCLIERGLYLLLKLIVIYWPIPVLIMICLHLLLLRFVVLEVAFAGRNILLTRPLRYSYACANAFAIIKAFDSFQRSATQFFGIDNPQPNTFSLLKKGLDSLLGPIMYYLDIFRRMDNKFHNLTEQQSHFYHHITNIQELVESNKLLEFIEDKIDGNNERNMEPSTFLRIMQEINVNIESLRTILIDFANVNAKWYHYHKYQNILYNDLLGSLNQYRVELTDYFDFDEYKMKTKDNAIIDYIIIKGKVSRHNRNRNRNNVNNSNRNKTLMIICGPNGAPFENFARNISLDTYLEQGVDVLCWNYRGYGYSTGKATFENLRSDVIELFETVDKMNIWNRYGVQGISVGGVPCCYLAHQKNKIELLISDRNFGSMDLIANVYPFGNILYMLYKVLLIPSSYTVKDYFNARCYKIVLNDPDDTIVKESASLKTVTSKYIINNFLIKKEVNSYSSNNMELIETRILSNRDSLNNLSSSDPREITINNNTKTNSNLDGLDFLLNSKKEKANFIQCLSEISIMLNSPNFVYNSGNCITKKFKQVYEKICKRNNNSYYSNLKEEGLQNLSNVYDFIKDKLNAFLTGFESSGDNLGTLLGIKANRLKDLFIRNFFSNFIIWGNRFYYANNADIHFFGVDSTLNHLNDQIEVLNSFLNSPEIQNFKNYQIISNSANLLEYLKIIRDNLVKLDIKKQIQYTNLSSENNGSNVDLIGNSGKESNKTQDLHGVEILEKNLQKIGRGNLIGLNCGHNGALNYEESCTFKYQMEISGFFEENKNLE